MQQTAKGIIELYIEGKDTNKPEILEDIYSVDSELVFDILPSTISFPAQMRGNLDIANTLSRDFNNNHDYVKTYCLADVPEQLSDGTVMGQPWLVVMRDKHTHQIKIGAGLYDWYFARENDSALKISRHKITIAVMLLLDVENFCLLNALQSELPYPWVSRQRVSTLLGSNSLLDEIVQYLGPNSKG